MYRPIRYATKFKCNIIFIKALQTYEYTSDKNKQKAYEYTSDKNN